MKISYKKLWIMLIERDIPKSVFRKETELSPGTMSKRNKNEEVRFPSCCASANICNAT